MRVSLRYPTEAAKNDFEKLGETINALLDREEARKGALPSCMVLASNEITLDCVETQFNPDTLGMAFGIYGLKETDPALYQSIQRIIRDAKSCTLGGGLTTIVEYPPLSPDEEQRIRKGLERYRKRGVEVTFL